MNVMGVTPQAVLAWLGVMAFAGAGVSLAVAARTYFRLDIRAVRADLSGRRRAEEVGSSRLEAPAVPSRRAEAVRRASVPAADAGRGPTRGDARVHGEVRPSTFRVTRRIVLVSSDEVIGEKGASA